MAARLAIARAQRQLSSEAGVHLFTRNFAVINQVGASSLQATLECNQFANAHPHDSHYDQASFVGLAVSIRLRQQQKSTNSVPDALLI